MSAHHLFTPPAALPRRRADDHPNVGKADKEADKGATHPNVVKADKGATHPNVVRPIEAYGAIHPSCL
jgi:hypothetical protein